MTIAKVINVGAEQLIALPTGFHLDAEQVNIIKQKNSLVIKVIPNTEYLSDNGISKRQASFLAWRKAYEATFDESDYENFENPWDGLRSKDDGREFNWEN